MHSNINQFTFKSFLSKINFTKLIHLFLSHVPVKRVDKENKMSYPKRGSWLLTIWVHSC